ncbi:hypothetical protein GW915_12720 [bacterium]|nr:hypothetical protein [bacterium]
MKKVLLISAVFVTIFASFWGVSRPGYLVLADDTHLSGPVISLFNFDGSIDWDEQYSQPIENGAEFQILRRWKDQLTPVSGLRFVLKDGEAEYFSDESGVVVVPECVAGESISLRMETKEELFEIRSENEDVYTKMLNLKCLERNVALVDEASPAGQLLGIWQIAFMGKTKLSESVGLDFWTHKLKFHWPASGDYYSYGGNLYISAGNHWDVVAHEMGHAIYDLANVGSFGGGQHYIDRCYSNALALSEGWASYYAAFITQDRADTDAKFEFMVPRRAPIQIENVPEDVCREPTNEWRVMSFLWDLYDVNSDPEMAEYNFQMIWDVTLNGGFRSVDGIRDALKTKGFDAQLVDDAWSNNF